MLSKFPRVKLFFDTVEGRPGVKKWVASEQRKKVREAPTPLRTASLLTTLTQTHKPVAAHGLPLGAKCPQAGRGRQVPVALHLCP